jgi:hypothetical protein
LISLFSPLAFFLLLKVFRPREHRTTFDFHGNSSAYDINLSI